MSTYTRLLVSLACLPAAAWAQSVPAPSSATDAEDASVELAPMVVTGTRFNGRLVAESPVPIDVIAPMELSAGGYTDLQRMLKARVPAFSLPNSIGSGSPDFVNAPTLRGLGIGQMLVLVNGKRRHTTGDVSTGQQIGRGDVGYDFNPFPAETLGRVEVLRDGASAQYGSDAIAGVINLVLDRTPGGRVTAMVGGTTEGDGEVLDFTAGYGVPLGQRGFLRATVFRQDHGHTNRAGLDTRQQYFGSDGTVMPSGNYGSGTGLTPSNGTLDPREATIDRNTYRFGSPDYVHHGIVVNAEYPVFDDATVYAFGGWSLMEGDSPGFFRRAGQNETVRAIHPDGFLPMGPYDLLNRSLAVGMKGVTAAGWSWDLSSVYGGNQIDNRYTNTNNASLGADSPTSFYRGGTRFAQWTNNLDLSREFPLGERAPLKVAFGLEHREEFYRILVGEPLSYANGGAVILDGPNAGNPAPIGVQPASGYRPSDATRKDRRSQAVYLDVEHKLTEAVTLSTAVRHEHYSDFGDTTTYKAAGRFQLARPLALRASLSTGFRAPHLAQSWFANSTNTVVSGVLVTARLLSVADPVATLLGASALRPEESVNQSAGLVFEHGSLSVSLDAYRIRVSDRIALSSNFTGAAVTSLLADAGFPNISSASYPTNAVDTDTRGAELTVRHRQSLGDYGRLTTTLGAMVNETRFDRIAPTPQVLADLGVTTPLFDLSQQVRFTTSQPKDKFILGLDWAWRTFAVNLTNIRYGEFEAVAFTSLTPARIAVVTEGYRHRLEPTAPASGNFQVVQIFEPRIITDVEVTWRATERVSVSVGVNNLFDVYPTRNFPSTAASVAAGTNGSDNAGTLLYNYATPHDTNGTFLFSKLRWSF